MTPPPRTSSAACWRKRFCGVTGCSSMNSAVIRHCRGDAGPRSYNPRMKTVLDLLPLLAFGLAYYFGGIYPATVALMVALAVTVLVLYVLQLTGVIHLSGG